jgi:hypothetical protein
LKVEIPRQAVREEKAKLPRENVRAEVKGAKMAEVIFIQHAETDCDRRNS